MKTLIIMNFLDVVLILAAFGGWISCIVKTANCNWNPIDKAEAIYTLGIFTGAGAIIGYIDIEDK